jgi:hypothetical protein
MGYLSTASTEFLTTTGAWIQHDGEVLAMIRYHASAGSRDYEFYQSVQAFGDRLQTLPSRTCIIVFRGRHLPLRGRVDQSFIDSAVSAIEEGKEWLIKSFQKNVAGRYSWFPYSCGDSLEELRSELENYRDQIVAVGLHPDWLEDNEVVLSAIVPEADGSVVTGIY